MVVNYRMLDTWESEAGFTCSVCGSSEEAETPMHHESCPAQDSIEYLYSLEQLQKAQWQWPQFGLLNMLDLPQHLHEYFIREAVDNGTLDAAMLLETTLNYARDVGHPVRDLDQHADAIMMEVLL